MPVLPFTIRDQIFGTFQITSETQLTLATAWEEKLGWPRQTALIIMSIAGRIMREGLEDREEVGWGLAIDEAHSELGFDSPPEWALDQVSKRFTEVH